MRVFLVYFSMLSVLVPLSVALFNYKLLSHALRIVSIIILVSALSEISSILMLELKSNNSPVFHVYIIISTLLFTAFYYTAFTDPVLKKAGFFLSSAALLIILLSTFFIQGIWEYPSVSNTVRNILMIISSLLYFYQLLNRQEFIPIEKQALFWINSGILIYSSINIFIFLLFTRMTIEERQQYYGIHSVTNIVTNLLFTIGLFCKPQKTP